MPTRYFKRDSLIWTETNRRMRAPREKNGQSVARSYECGQFLKTGFSRETGFSSRDIMHMKRPRKRLSWHRTLARTIEYGACCETIMFVRETILERLAIICVAVAVPLSLLILLALGDRVETGEKDERLQIHYQDYGEYKHIAATNTRYSGKSYIWLEFQWKKTRNLWNRGRHEEYI